MPCCKGHLPCWLGGGACKKRVRQNRSGREIEREREKERERKNGCVRQGDAGIEHNRMRDRERNEED